MINHSRTLLLNLPGERQPSIDVMYDAYIPVYSAIKLNSQLSVFYNALFGSRPDYQGMCCRVAQCLSTVSSTPYGKYLTAFDSRITYDFSGVRADTYPQIITTTTDGATLSVTGSHRIPDGQGRSDSTWTIRWRDGNGYMSGTDTDDILVSSTMPVRLSGSNLVVNGTVINNSTWNIRFRDMPHDFHNTIDFLLGSDVIRDYIFNSSLSEPIRTFYSLTTHSMFPYRATGLLLAYIYRLEQWRNV